MLKRGHDNFLGNTRGQEGVTLTSLLLIILGAVVVVAIILGATGVFDLTFGLFEQAPGQSLQAAVSSCEIAGESGLKADYCSRFREVEINGKDQFVTCSWLGSKNYLEIELEGGCGELTVNEEAYCTNENLKDGTMVNNHVCATAKAADVGADDLAKDADEDSGKTIN